jgi:hypothetical protein
MSIHRRSVPALAAVLLMLSCDGSTPGTPVGTAPPGARADAALVGSWRIHSSRLFFDAGGASHLGTILNTPGSRTLDLFQDGTWKFGRSSGSWSVSEAAAEDWKRWGVEAYGPKRKIVLSGWNQGQGTGPVEESDKGIDFFWILYRAEPPAVSDPGMVHAKFGR